MITKASGFRRADHMEDTCQRLRVSIGYPEHQRRHRGPDYNHIIYLKNPKNHGPLIQQEMKSLKMKALIYSITFVFLLTTSAMAKRNTPEKVSAIQTSEAVFSVPHFAKGDCPQNGGFIEAHHPKTKQLLWRIRVYKTDYNPALEKDVQDVFITSLSFDKVHNLLIMADEKSRVFVLNLTTKKVTQIH